MERKHHSTQYEIPAGWFLHTFFKKCMTYGEMGSI